MKKILYFVIFDHDFSRNKVYADGLKLHGFEVIYCIDKSRGPLKFFKLFKKTRALKGEYDVIIVGYPGYIVTPFARLFAWNKPIIFDALCSFYESQIISRDAYRGNPFRIPYVKLVDWLATRSADYILVETEAQKEYFVQKLGVAREKAVVTYTGVDEAKFHFDQSVQKNEKFTVLFRGRITQEAGLKYVLEAAKILERDSVDFLVVGYGWGPAKREFDEILKNNSFSNITFISKHVATDELNRLMLQCHASLGQFSDNERVERTIPHKAFEAMVLKLPYITSRTVSVSEIARDGENCLLTNKADARDLAEKILKLKNSSELQKSLAENNLKTYLEHFTPKEIVNPLIKIL